MKILLLTTHLNLGGIGIYVLSQAKGLVQRNHEVFVASSGGDLVALLESFGVEHLLINIKTKSAVSPKILLTQRKIARIIKEKNIEIIHAHTRVTQVLAHLLSKKTGAPYVTTCHGFFRPHRFRKILPCWGKRSIAISEAVREHLVNDLGVKKEVVTVVHNGVEIEKFSPDKFNRAQKEEFRKNYGLKDTGPVIGTVARFSSVKGQRYLIPAMKRILETHPAAQLLLVGEGPEKKRLLDEAEELEIEDKVFFGPPALDTSVPLSIMDVFVLPSLLEGLGLAIIEAQAMGLPCVATDVGGIYTLVKDGVNGFLVHPREPTALAEAILKLLIDKELAQKFGREARIQATASFNLKQMIDGIEEVYKEVLKK
ncbi:MAG: glycosyltransferase family 4 protein [Candidatus Omnitrophota bacterium]|nr:MAG: glycosyltransferase family 4 protein [Candidatus Omnitrophota bacterium]